MPPLKRRHFLQVAGSSLAAMGLSQTRFLRQADHYRQALAQDTPRKLALLIGINQYPDAEGVPNLFGCLNDVEMQYQLLVHRFGFNPSDILRITDDADMLPTRANILQAFEEHLIQQARPGDVVVVHYSGHGALVTDPDAIVMSQCPKNSYPAGSNGTLVPRDRVSERRGDDNIQVSDITGRSLFLLMERIQTDQLTVVLDSCFSGAGIRGNAQVRSVAQSRRDFSSEGSDQLPSPEELDNQQRWMQELGWDQTEISRRRSEGISRGVAIGSTSCHQLAYEQPYDDSQNTPQTAGIFTYLLTSYLWQLPVATAISTVKTDLVRSTRASVSHRNLQVPIFETQPGTDNLGQSVYFTQALAPFAEGVVLTVTAERKIECWLGGMSSLTLKTAGAGAIYSLLDPASPGDFLGDIVLEWRDGLLANARLIEGSLDTVRSGLLLREKLAIIPNPSLRIGVDSSLAAEQTAAEAALQAVLGSPANVSTNRITVTSVDLRTDLEYLLARTSEDMQRQLRQSGETELPPIGSVGLYSANLTMLVPNSVGAANESAVEAVNRLQPTFKNLLVTRVLQELAGTPSDLSISGEIRTVSGRGPKIPIGNQRNRNGAFAISTVVAPEPYQADDFLEIQVTSGETQPVYLSCLVIDSTGNIIVLHPARWDAPEEAARIDNSINNTLVVPRVEDGVRFRVSGVGFIEVLTLVSTQPLRRVLRNLEVIARARGVLRGAMPLERSHSLNLLEDLLGDITEVSGSRSSPEILNRGDTAVDSGAISAFSAIVEIVD